MNYYEYMTQAADAVISQAENGLYYLEPSWRVILDSDGLEPNQVNDIVVSWDRIKEYLELDVKKRNTQNDKKPAVISWLHNVITSTVEPAMLQEETDYIRQVVEFMKENHSEKFSDDSDKYNSPVPV